MLYTLTLVVAVAAIMIYGLFSMRRQIQAVRRAATKERRRILAVVVGVSLVRWIASGGVLGAAFWVDLYCVPSPGVSWTLCTDLLLGLAVAAAAIAVLAEVIGHRIVRRHTEAIIDVQAPGAPVYRLELVRQEDKDDGEHRGPMAQDDT